MGMNLKFKIGDKVRVIKTRDDHPCKKLLIGKTYTINSINPNQSYFMDKLDMHYGVDKDAWVWFEDELELVEEKPFTKADLKPGMVVEHRDGERYMVIGNRVVSEDDCYKISDYNSDLKISNLCLSDSDIVAVYNVNTYVLYDISDIFSDVCLTTIWRREEAKEMTVSEIEKQLGYKVKIVDGE